MKIKDKLRLLGSFLLLGLVLLVSTKGTIESYFDFYYEKENPYKESLVDRSLSSIMHLKPIRVFLMYTGFNTGYGFFAPNVASDFLIVYETKDSADNITHTTNINDISEYEFISLKNNIK